MEYIRRQFGTLTDFVEAFKPKRSFVVGTGGVSLEDFLGCEIETLLDI